MEFILIEQFGSIKDLDTGKLAVRAIVCGDLARQIARFGGPWIEMSQLDIKRVNARIVLDFHTEL